MLKVLFLLFSFFFFLFFWGEILSEIPICEETGFLSAIWVHKQISPLRFHRGKRKDCVLQLFSLMRVSEKIRNWEN